MFPTPDSAIAAATAIPKTGTLYIAAPDQELHERLRGALAAALCPCGEPHRGVLEVELVPGMLERLSVELGHRLTGTALSDCSALVLTTGAVITIADLARMQPLSRLLVSAQCDWLRDLVTQGRLTTYFQPIVHMHDPTQVYAYESLLRGFDEQGRLIAPKAIFDTARATGSLNMLDSLARTTAMKRAVALGVAAHLFINFIPVGFNSPSYQITKMKREVQAAGADPTRIVFEIVETDRVEEVHELQHLVAEYRKAGFRIALDDVGAGYNSLNLIVRIKPDFIKLDVDLVRDVHLDPYKREVASKLLEAARNLGVIAVAEGIESETEWRWLTDHGAELGQGFAFARPAAHPPIPVVPQGCILHGAA